MQPDGEQINLEFNHSEEGIDIAVARRYAWHFSDTQEARKYFKRRRIQYTALRWGLRSFVLAGMVDVVHGIDQLVNTHDVFAGAGVVIVSGLSLIVEGLNEQTVGERVRVHRAVMRRLNQPTEE